MGAAWIGRWVGQKIRENSAVQDVESVGDQVLRVKRARDVFALGTTAVECVTGATLRTLEPEDLGKLSFVVNVPKDSYWVGEAIDRLLDCGVAFGGMSDLHRALSQCADVRQYRNREFAYVERALSQHDAVEDMTRVHDRKYVLHRRTLPNYIIVLINEYELTKEHVRTARERYGNFDAILITNPNGNATAQAREIAKGIGSDVYHLGQLMGRISGP